MELFFSYLGRVDEDATKLKGDTITGKWADFDTTGRAITVEDFVNWPSTPEAILKFTRNFGPLTGRRDLVGTVSRHSKNIGLVGRGSDFVFSLKDWRKVQDRMQREWILHSDSVVPYFPGLSVHLILQGQTLTLAGKRDKGGNSGKAVLGVNTLAEYFQLQLASLDLRFVKVCRNPDCKGQRFFVAKKSSGKLCGAKGCKEWNKKEIGKRCWHKNKDKYTSA